MYPNDKRNICIWLMIINNIFLLSHTHTDIFSHKQSNNTSSVISFFFLFFSFFLCLWAHSQSHCSSYFVLRGTVCRRHNPIKNKRKIIKRAYLHIRLLPQLFWPVSFTFYIFFSTLTSVSCSLLLLFFFCLFHFCHMQVNYIPPPPPSGFFEKKMYVFNREQK